MFATTPEKPHPWWQSRKAKVAAVASGILLVYVGFEYDQYNRTNDGQDDNACELYGGIDFTMPDEPLEIVVQEHYPQVSDDCSDEIVREVRNEYPDVGPDKSITLPVRAEADGKTFYFDPGS